MLVNQQKQTGFGLILLIVGLALMAVLFAWYLTGTGSDSDDSKSPMEAGQEGINQAKEIDKNNRQYQSEINQQLEVQDIQNQLP